MCYETSLTKELDFIEDYTDAEILYYGIYEPYYHVSGYTHPNLFCLPMEDPSNIYPMEWGLLPHMADLDIITYRKDYNNLIARGETLLQSKLYKEPARQRRCLILADGFFEPHYPNDNFGGKAVPKYCYLEGRKLFCFAGIYNEFDDEYWNVSLVTTDANDFFSKINNKEKRMPLVLDPAFEEEWLRKDLSDKGILDLVKYGFIKDEFKAHSVVNFYKCDFNTNRPEILEKVEENPNLFNE
ncbi:SOS response-associated peptidase [Salegentibacter sp. JZCK2]|uniref:SOS response-associated peptidase n=1 Tax=Salegentibacter tibetensis TaxID=2873600 RepID=UPI001CCA9FC2|nr:SOS response-associated peptidase family protein [Salegentibacter tibetensis]MBZ9731426.1 SOS response-associated peptidase [Salegentibacter tibetensis]